MLMWHQQIFRTPAGGRRILQHPTPSRQNLAANTHSKPVLLPRQETCRDLAYMMCVGVQHAPMLPHVREDEAPNPFSSCVFSSGRRPQRQCKSHGLLHTAVEHSCMNICPLPDNGTRSQPVRTPPHLCHHPRHLLDCRRLLSPFLLLLRAVFPPSSRWPWSWARWWRTRGTETRRRGASWWAGRRRAMWVMWARWWSAGRIPLVWWRG
ncbi:hypothetical protein CC85DRAFT_32746 [Cutaneotrichosporon oleaginosum]|uniref:Uncharacterized protein n=1 Tax=Cutaneotrichosporon oleaginosum TaxID=879819 RepID=A0A0J0XSU4_9TREE|nr:uncharacterized protein CC85DRAFT_32746 [Cutaneotrichosporon oleaginosum]KLT44148.1 hypothetical protein CC85DRAFT_32746 [Cutaneotrichosporon oleaginosum]TXT09397.1 hypothetical protein COLE_03331 [Cutaneotrichosporon oleaginosum]